MNTAGRFTVNYIMRYRVRVADNSDLVLRILTIYNGPARKPLNTYDSGICPSPIAANKKINKMSKSFFPFLSVISHTILDSYPKFKVIRYQYHGLGFLPSATRIISFNSFSKNSWNLISFGLYKFGSFEIRF
jgi:hypothetical protein